MVRVLCITTKLCTGGVQTFLVSYAKQLVKYDVLLDFVVQTTEPQLYDEELIKLGCRIFPVRSYQSSKFYFLKDIYKLLKKYPEYKIVHAHLNYVNVFPLFAAYLAKCPIRISHSHSNYKPSGLYARIARIFARNLINFFATDYWTCSLASARWLYGNKDNVIVIRNSVDYNQYSYNQITRDYYRKLLKINDNQSVWIHVGSYNHVKNHTFLLKLFKEYLTVDDNVKLLLCGDGTLKDSIDREIISLGIQENVIQLGNKKNVSDYLNVADVFVFPSLFEGVPFSLIEAQASGLPIVVSSAISDEALFGNYYKCKTFDIQEWSRIISQIKYKDRICQHHLLISSKFDLEEESRCLANLYRSKL